MSQSALFDFERMDAEADMAKRLAQHGHPNIFAGLTATADRRERIRTAILDAGLDCAGYGYKPGTKKPETYAEAFQRLFDQPLEPSQGKSRAKSRTA